MLLSPPSPSPSSSPLSVIYLDANEKTVHFFVPSEIDSSKFEYGFTPYGSDISDGGFFSEFGEILHEYSADRGMNFDKTVLVLPDSLFITDTVRIPASGRRTSSASLSTTIASLYKNADDIKFNSSPIVTENSAITYALAGIRHEYIDKFRRCCEDERVTLKAVTFASNAAVNAALAISSELRGAQVLLLNAEKTCTSFACVVGAQTVGFHTFPIGLDASGTLSETDAFRAVTKRALDLLRSNSDVLGNIDTVVVNLPSEYRHIYDNVDAELSGRRIKFRLLPECNEKLPLALFGGTFVKQYNKNNNF